jgi:DNA repair protein RecN (Recombination protein N)
MLRRLHISNFALIESIDLTIDGGMTVLLGETGAGKSIIIDALAAALGERLPSDSLRSGAKKAVIEAVFHVAPTHPARGCIARHELDWEADDIILRRELTASGDRKSVV